jgi:predicted RNA-binding Zn ribbon-like protein
MSKSSRKFRVPDPLANLYDFANTLDLRRFTYHRVEHQQGDELGSASDLGDWLSERGLLDAGARVDAAAHQSALQLRAAIRAYLECDPDHRNSEKDVVRSLNETVRRFPIVVQALHKDGMKLQSARSDALSGLSQIVAELYDASATGTLGRLKACASEECRRIFYDRSKPGSRRWCQSTLCGNRAKTRNYRERQKLEL